MKIGKKIFLLLIPVVLLIASCGESGGKKCDCPKFGSTDTGYGILDNAGNS